MRFLRRWLLCLSLSTLILLPAWNELIPGSVARYFGLLEVGSIALSAMALNTLALSLILAWIWPCFQGEGTARRWLRALWSTLLIILTALSIRAILGQQFLRLNGDAVRAVLPQWSYFVMGGVISGLLMAAFVRAEERTLHAARVALKVVMPLGALLLLRAGWHESKSTPVHQFVPSVASTTGPKVVFVVFDEMDYGWSYDYRPRGMALPQLDALAKESTFFTQAFPPNSETNRSIPSLLCGRLVDQAKVGPGPDYELRFKGDDQWKVWSQVEDLPYLASAMGRSNLIVDFYHAYGSAYLARRPLTELKRFPAGKWAFAPEWHQSVLSAARHEWLSVGESFPGLGAFVVEPGDIARRKKALEDMTIYSLEALRQGGHGFYFLHFPVPHAPLLWDGGSRAAASIALPAKSSLENLLLVDRILGQLRSALESSGQWDSCLFILTSDHWQRKAFGERLPPRPAGEFRRVPLLIKFPGQVGEVRVDTPVSNLMVHRLILDSLGGRELGPRDLRLTPSDLRWEGVYNPWLR